jgi:hypothetical protein
LPIGELTVIFQEPLIDIGALLQRL